MSRSNLTQLAIGLSFLGLAACGGTTSTYVKNVTVTTYEQNSEKYVSVTADIDSAQLVMPVVQLAMPNPHNANAPYGFVQVTPNLASGTQLRVDLDTNVFGKWKPPTFKNTLPNGLPLPVAGFGPKAVTIDITKNSQLYVDIDVASKKALLGIALSIDNFKTGLQGGIFFPFPTSIGLSGVAGVFTGPAAGTSGFALFADASSIVDQIGGIVGLSGMTAKAKTAPVSFKTIEVNADQVYQMLYDVNSSGETLRIQ